MSAIAKAQHADTQTAATADTTSDDQTEARGDVDDDSNETHGQGDEAHQDS